MYSKYLNCSPLTKFWLLELIVRPALCFEFDMPVVEDEKQLSWLENCSSIVILKSVENKIKEEIYSPKNQSRNATINCFAFNVKPRKSLFEVLHETMDALRH